jgi:hypothetical protein
MKHMLLPLSSLLKTVTTINTVNHRTEPYPTGISGSMAFALLLHGERDMRNGLRKAMATLTKPKHKAKGRPKNEREAFDFLGGPLIKPTGLVIRAELAPFPKVGGIKGREGALYGGAI